MSSAIADDRLPVLWLTGPAGVGKSTVSWRLFTELTERGVAAAFADTDQLRMCYPAPPGDPGREQIKARNLGALLANYQAAGARRVIANGVLDPAAGPYRELMPKASLTVCRLRAGPADLASRLTARRGADGIDAVLTETFAEADAMDASDWADVCVDTTGLGPAEVLGRVRARLTTWLYQAGTPHDAPPASSRDAAPQTLAPQESAGRILLITGPTGVGKSTIGFEFYLRCLQAGLTAGYLDLRQVSIVHPGRANDPGGHQLMAANLAAIWRTFHDAGARHLIVTGSAESAKAIPSSTRAVPAAQVTVARLHAGPAELRGRVLSRGEGGSWPEPGHPLNGLTTAQLQRTADAAIASGDVLEQDRIGSLRIDTGGRSPAESAGALAAALAWPELRPA